MATLSVIYLIHSLCLRPTGHGNETTGTKTMKLKANDICSGKDRHDSEADAYAAASRRAGNRHDKPAALRAYLCPECHGWHLTKQVEDAALGRTAADNRPDEV